VHELGHAVSFEKWRKGCKALPGQIDNKKGPTKYELSPLSAKPTTSLQMFIDRKEYVTKYVAYEADGKSDRVCAELFAEAYSLWTTNPQYLKTNHPQVFKWFDTVSLRHDGQ
jgi:hypothetical protein